MTRASDLFRQIRTVALAVAFLIVFLTAFEVLFAESPVRFLQVFVPTAVTTLCCSLFCSLLLFCLFERMMGLRRPFFYAAFALLVAAGVLAGVTAANVLLTGRPRIQGRILLFSLITGLAFSAVISGYFVFRFRLEQKITKIKAIELENERLRRLETETRLRDLQSKLNPHFLFNSLNATAALIYDDPAAAERSIERLSGIYRRVLSMSNRSLIPLGNELDLVVDYLELEKLRFDEKLLFAVSCPDELRKTLVPGFVVEPLVENSVKHGFDAPGRVLRVRVGAAAEADGRIRLTVEDDGPGFDVGRTGAGFGVFGIQERLRLLYDDRAALDIRSTMGRGTTATILLPGLTA
jgi:two-component system LytT family sensor kinase